MKKFAIGTLGVGALAGSALGLAANAAAYPSGPSNAADTVSSLQAQGFNVVVNGVTNVPLSECRVTAVNPTGPPPDSSQFTTVYVDISCPSPS